MADKIQSPLLIEIFSRNRDRLNSLYAFTKHSRHNLNSSAFTEFLVRVVEPLVEILEKQDYTLLETMVVELYEKILLLTARNFTGNRGKFPWFEDCLAKLLHHFPLLALNHPADFMASMANGLINVTAGTGAAVLKWTDFLLGLPADSTGMTDLKRLGLAAAWVNGMAPYREKALEYCAAADCSRFCQLFELSPGLVDDSLKAVIVEKMRKNPWLTPRDILENSAPGPVLKTAGGFTAFGGEFPVPPEVFLAGDFLAAFAGDACYRIFADSYGCCLVRMNSESAVNRLTDSSGEFRIDRPGVLVFHEKEYTLESAYMIPAASQAAAGTTLCFTSPVSHKVFIAGIKDV